MAIKKLIKSCKELNKKYSELVEDYSSRLSWAKRQQLPISEFDAETLEMLDNEIAVTKQNLESQILVLELQLPRD